jgi:hypothetical protein
VKKARIGRQNHAIDRNAAADTALFDAHLVNNAVLVGEHGRALPAATLPHRQQA